MEFICLLFVSGAVTLKQQKDKPTSQYRQHRHRNGSNLITTELKSIAYSENL
jgi:hypothetical protein